MTRSPIQIDVSVDPAFADFVEVALLTRAARATLRQADLTDPVALTLVVTGDGTVRRLNRTFRGIDASTDVLAFWDQAQGDFATPPGSPRYLGDVVVSFPRAEAQARQGGHPVEAELQLLAVHGVLHLLGHDHLEPEERAAMWSAQEAILNELGVDVAGPKLEV